MSGPGLPGRSAPWSAEEAVAYLNSPRWQEVKPGLERIGQLMAALGDPQDAVPVVHVAGTNGKGSTSAMVARILQEAGFKTGLFTSPFLFEFAERIRIDGTPIDDGLLADTTWQVRQAAQAMDEHPTEFELMTAVALAAFAQAGCDVAVLEVGLGGRLDSTNVVSAPAVCAITPIDLDHTALLGSRIEDIAREKAGIIKPGSAVVSAQQDPRAACVIASAAQAAGTQPRFVDEAQIVCAPAPAGSDAKGVPGAGDARACAEFSYGPFSDLRLGMPAPYQRANAALACLVVEALREQGWDIPDRAVRTGLARVSWPGRFQVVKPPAERMPRVVLDGGHNPQGARMLADALTAVFPGVRPVFVMGVLSDKDHEAMLRAILPLAQALVCVAPDNPRALAAHDLAREAQAILAERDRNHPHAQPAFKATGASEATAASDAAPSMIPIIVADTVEEGVAKGVELAGADGLACCCGSLYGVAQYARALERLGYQAC